jgi:hypothetical protein
MWFQADDCGLVALNLVSVAPNVVSRPRIESLNVVEKSAMIAVQPSDDCSSLHVAGPPIVLVTVEHEQRVVSNPDAGAQRFKTCAIRLPPSRPSSPGRSLPRASRKRSDSLSRRPSTSSDSSATAFISSGAIRPLFCKRCSCGRLPPRTSCSKASRSSRA